MKQTTRIKKINEIGDTTSPATSAKQDDIISELKSISGFEIPAHDTIEATYPTDATEVYTYKDSGDTVATITVTYTDSTKEVLTSVVKT